MAVTKAYELRKIELEINDMISDAWPMPFRCVRGAGLIIEERILLALLDIASRNQYCRTKIRELAKKVYDGDVLNNAYKRWSEGGGQ